ncbi:MAG: MBL fold metallo-hydrolase [Alphaproteobacteria bacterium]
MTTRRNLLTGAALLAAAPVLAPAEGRAAPADAASHKDVTQAPAMYRKKVGDITVTALSDGFIPLGPEAFGDYEQLVADTAAASPHPNPMRGHVNVYVVQTGGKTVLIDAGGPAAFVPSLGQMASNMTAAGFSPDQIDLIVLTHLHIDHVGGLTDDTGKAFFPNAELAVHEDELSFWTAEELLANADDGFRPLIEAAQGAVAAYKDRLKPFTGEAELAPGLTAHPAPGHTPGHTAFRISSGDQQLLVWGDIVHAPVVQFAHPEVTIGFDIDADMARKTRLGLLDMIATDSLLIGGMHLHFPAFGYVQRDGDAYKYAPALWSHDM